MSCRLPGGPAAALLALLCLGLLSLRFHSSLSPWGEQESPELGAPGPKARGLLLQDVFIAVKTTRAFHRSRLDLLLDTWVSRTKQQTFVFTDSWDRGLQDRLGSHLVITNCSAEHSHLALSCKMAAEFDAFLASKLRWFCHVDDDNYVNPRALLQLLKALPEGRDVYVGKPSLNRPIHTSEPRPHNRTRLVQFWFATGGAGFCINRKLALKMAPWASGPRFVDTSALIRLPDDCTVGYIVECKLGGRLQPSPLFHSHLETLQLLGAAQLLEQVTLSYGVFEGKLNVIRLPGPFSPEEDPSRSQTLVDPPASASRAAIDLRIVKTVDSWSTAGSRSTDPYIYCHLGLPGYSAQSFSKFPKRTHPKLTGFTTGSTAPSSWTVHLCCVLLPHTGTCVTKRKLQTWQRVASEDSL